MKQWLRWALLVGLAATAQAAAAQTPPPAQTGAEALASTLVEFRLTDGSIIYGTIQSATDDRIVVMTLAGAIVVVQRTQIASMHTAVGQVVDGEFLPADSNTTRLLFAPTARSLKQGQGYIGVYEFLLPFVQVGVTDRFSIGAGTPILFFGDDDGRPVWLTPKFQVYRGRRTSAAVGVMHFLVAGADARFGLVYAVATTGTDDNAFTAGAGWAYARYHEDQYAPCAFATPCPPPTQTTETVGTPVGMVGGERRISRRVKFVTENYVFEAGGIISGGVRFLGERLSADLGFFVPVGAEEFVVAPVINFVWTFGK